MRTRPRAARAAITAAVAVFTCAAMGLTGMPAGAAELHAKPPARPGKVSQLTITITKPAARYRVESDWTAVATATSYQVSLTSATGALLERASVAAPGWTGETTLGAGSLVTMTVVPFAGTRRGRATSVSRTLPDLTAPTGSYDVPKPVGSVATVTQMALDDDVSAPASITRTIDWGDGTGAENFTGNAMSHTYPTVDGLYRPVMTLTDEAQNTARITLRAVVIGDEAAPRGTFVAAPLDPWAALTGVTLTQTSLSDEFSLAKDIERVVTWGDGSAAVQWTSGTVLTHVYPVGGTFTPTVTLTDEAYNSSAPIAAAPVSVKVDDVSPTLRFTGPVRKRTSVRRWTVLRGLASDGAGTGVAVVRVKAVQRRSGTWYGFRPATGAWVKAGATKRSAFRKAGARQVQPAASGTWTSNLPRLRKGNLVVRVQAEDLVGNKSKRRTQRQRLVRR